jgi:NAD(P)-dependent dehydrogenase (short-subunit alcohol dehydrogenase family)
MGQVWRTLMGRFDGKVAIVTGAGRGIGAAHAKLLASEGAAVVVNDLGGDAKGEGADATPAQQVVADITSAGGRAVVNGGSVSSWKDAEALVQQAVDTFGGLDILVNNAGILRDRMSFTMDEADWDAVVDVHLKGHFAPSRFAAAYWRSKFKETNEPVNAKIVNTASESGLYGNAGQANYAAAKAGIASLTIVMARELERMGIRVNCICPVARTRLTATVAGTSDFMTPKEGEPDAFAPENISAVVAWLASDLSDGVTGQVVKVMGGNLQILRGWRPVVGNTEHGEWDLDTVADVLPKLLESVPKGIPPFLPNIGDV